jgi:anti-sigma factor RsiW
MTVTRDVIYDLLPGYFAGDVSADTRQLVDEFLATDPEFRRLTARFKTLLDARYAPRDTVPATEEGHLLRRARREAELPWRVRSGALIWMFASAFSWFMFLMVPNSLGWMHPGAILGVFFLLGAIAWFIASFYVRPDSWWRNVLGMDDQTLETAWLPRRLR